MEYKILENIDFSSSNESIAREYLMKFSNHLRNELIENTIGSNKNISLVSDDSSMDFLTKRLALIADTGIISHRTTSEFKFIGRQNYRESVFESADSEEEYDLLHSDVPDLEYLGEWIKKCKDLISTNRIIYLPRSKKEHVHVVHGYQGRPPSVTSQNPVADAIIKNKRLVDINTVDVIKNKYIRSILKLNIPLVDNTSLEFFSKVTADEKSQVDVLKNYLKDLFLKIEEQENSEYFYTKMEQVSLKIEREMRTIENDFKALRRKRAFQISGSTVATIVATLVAIDNNIFDIVGKIIGTGGGLYLFFETFRDGKISKGQIKENPVYYFWLLDTKLKEAE